MKYKVAICKIHMLGEPALVLGFCRYDDDDAFWQKFQYFTMEPYLNTDSTTDMAVALKIGAQSRTKYHGKVVHFDSINKDVKVLQCGHDFDLGKAEAVEISKDDWKALSAELVKDDWMDFDEETWGK